MKMTRKGNINWINFDTLSDYKKTLPQALSIEKTVEKIENYFSSNKILNQYGLSLSLDVSMHRFGTLYKKHEDPRMREIIEMAINYINNEALQNKDNLYNLSMRYVLVRQNINKDFLELDEQVQQSKATVLVLPAKE